MQYSLPNIIKYISVILLMTVNSPIISKGQNLLRQPESVTFDSKRNRYLVSNKQNGEIIAISENGVQSKFKTGLSSCRGLVIVNDILFVASQVGVVGINLESSAITMTVTISGSQFLNDIAADSSGNLYLSDSQGSKIFKLNISSQVYSTLASSNVEGCNGLHFDKLNNRLLVCLWSFPGLIKAVDLSNNTVTTVIRTDLDQCDGLTEDNFGNIYISSWTANSVYRYDPSFTKQKELVSSEHSGPADIFYCKTKNILAVPNFNSNNVEFLLVIPTNIMEEIKCKMDYTLLQNYPNPFNPTTTIKYHLPSKSNVKIIISNVLGETIDVLLDEIQSAGYHECKFTAYNLASGIYFCRLIADNYFEKKKMMLLK